MKEIRFRAWDNFNECFHFQASDSTASLAKLFKQMADFQAAGNGIIFNQFTGLKDKNGNEIYEGDVVKCHDHPTGVEDVTGVVTYHCGAFMIPGSMMLLRDYGTAWTEVIGNLHQNPELLQS